MLNRVLVLSLAVAIAFSGTIFAEDTPAKPQPTGPSSAPAPDAMKLPSDPKEALAAARWLEKTYRGSRPPEAVRMLIAIANGTWMRPNGGWFGPCETRYTWEWLARHHEVKNGGITLKQFRGPAVLFPSLDRDRDGQITAADLDWSDNSPYLKQTALAGQLYQRINAQRDGKLTKDEMLAFFKTAAKGKDRLSLSDLEEALLAPVASVTLGPGDAPNQEMLVRSLFSGELGSLNEGPGLNQAAPDFALKTPDGKSTVQLSKLIGPRPLVLVLGNYTCAPFRRTSLEVEKLYQRYKDHATFVGVYVREAHPTDGWVMISNTRRGVAVKQPKTYAERAEVCTKFCEFARPSFPFLVDEINDPVGNAYSGMPGRFYVIDPKGKVAYKSGRGPFGFKLGEFEQALAMSLLEFPAPANTNKPRQTQPTTTR